MAKPKARKSAAAARKKSTRRSTTARKSPARKPAAKRTAAKKAAPKKAAARKSTRKAAAKSAPKARGASARKAVKRAVPKRETTRKSAPKARKPAPRARKEKEAVAPPAPEVVEVAAEEPTVETTSAGTVPLAPEHAPVDDLTSTGNEILDIFQKYDRNRTGYIERPEFARLLEALGQEDLTEEDLEIAFDMVDTERTGRISWRQFKNWWTNR